MGTRKSHNASAAALEDARRWFERWRRARKMGTRIPDALWAAAVEAADTSGVCRTATVLRLDYYSLKKRVEQQAAADGGSPPQFVELRPAAPSGVAECVLELEDSSGAKMRLQMQGVTVSDLATLTRNLWSGVS